MFLDILKGFAIGICASAPIGPIAILVIQKSLSKGHKAGFITGMGACVVDTVFSIIAIFALAAAERLINENRELILPKNDAPVDTFTIYKLKNELDQELARQDPNEEVILSKIRGIASERYRTSNASVMLNAKAIQKNLSTMRPQSTFHPRLCTVRIRKYEQKHHMGIPEEL